MNKFQIKSGVIISANSVIISEETLNEAFNLWSDKEKNLFKKILKQGGLVTIKGVRYNITNVDSNYESENILSWLPTSSDTYSEEE
jgi:hypothetical protein